jgi:hypothetical protein
MGGIFSLKRLGLITGTKADKRHPKPCPVEVIPPLVQLHRMFSAEGSAKVTKKDKDQWLRFPQIAQAARRTV